MDFILTAENLILENLSNEHFGVSELANAMNMSRSNLLRKIKKEKGLSASQFIRQIRLGKGMELLQETPMTVSEVAHQVGFGNSSYFTKCFREHYGYPPGDAAKRIAAISASKKEENPSFLKQYQWPIITTAAIIVLMVSFFMFAKQPSASAMEIEKSIAVLPFKNESSDSSNLYFVNGLMESTLNNLQRIEDLRVISRTSVEKYRHSEKGIPEIAEELHVNYLVEGSGQRVGNQVLLNIQLIEATTDRSLWVKQYKAKVNDLFSLQNEVAKEIADAIAVQVTPAALEQIEKKPTDNLVAYDYYLQALDPFFTRSKEGLEKAIPLFEKAIAHDPQFALAHSNIAISYYFLDLSQKQKQYTEHINNYADKGLLYDSKSDVSLIAKALYYMHTEEYRLALPHLEKALEYNPNSTAVIQVLSSVYNHYILDTGKYLEYALKGIQLDIAANDSIGKSYIYLNLSNALIQTGFTEEADMYINKSLAYDPGNYYAPYVKAFILYAKEQDLELTKNALIQELEKDSTRLDIVQEVAKMYYFQEDYSTAFAYYKKFVEARKKHNLGIYPHEDIKIAVVYEKMGYLEEAKAFLSSYATYCENDKSPYKSASRAIQYVYEGKNEEAIAQYEIFATQDNYQYWILLFLEKDPLLKSLKTHPKYEATMQKIKDKFWKNQRDLKASLKKKGLM